MIKFIRAWSPLLCTLPSVVLLFWLVMFVGAKLFGAIDWHWIWVLLPAWILLLCFGLSRLVAVFIPSADEYEP